MEKHIEIIEYTKAYEPQLIEFLEKCLPQSGRALDINGRHFCYKNTSDFFKIFWCMLDSGQIIGVVAVKELSETSCELKSLYLLENYHGRGLGKCLLNKAIAFANESGYEKMYLDSLSTSTNAIALYRKTGFSDTERYNNNERSDVFMVLDLTEYRR